MPFLLFFQRAFLKLVVVVIVELVGNSLELSIKSIIFQRLLHPFGVRNDFRKCPKHYTRSNIFI